MTKYFLLLLFPLSALAQQAQKNSEEKIKLVENSLVPSVIYGDSIIKHNLEERMKETHIKGLSIAVIQNYQVIWAKGYGWSGWLSGGVSM